MSVPTPMPTAAQIAAQGYYSPTFTGYPWDPSLVHEETDVERKRRKVYERRAVREIECKRRKKYAATAWEAIKDVIRNDDKNRSKRCKQLTAPLIPPEPELDFTSSAWPTVNAGSSQYTPPSPFFAPSALAPLDSDLENTWAGHIQPLIPATPQPTTDPLPQHVQLNPYLAHQCHGHEPIAYDIGKGPTAITYKVNDWTSSPFGPEGLPATLPSVIQMNITAVVDDPLPHFPWSITVSNPLGITCGDVFDAIWEIFHKHVSNQEYQSWTTYRQKCAATAYYRRIGTDLNRLDLVPGTHDGMKRIDYMGGSVKFKGLSSAFADANGGWLLFVGASEG